MHICICLGRGEYISRSQGEYILRRQGVNIFCRVSAARGAYIAHSNLMGSQLTKVSVSSRLGRRVRDQAAFLLSCTFPHFSFVSCCICLQFFVQISYFWICRAVLTDSAHCLQSPHAWETSYLRWLKHFQLPQFLSFQLPQHLSFKLSQHFFPFQLLQLFSFQLTEKAPAQTKMPDPVVVSASAKHTVLFIILDRFRVEMWYYQATLIFLHGLGDTGHGWATTIAAIRPPHVKV